jgi:hypothetical protein
MTDGIDQKPGWSRVKTMGTRQSARARPETTQRYARQRKMERAMGIEPTGTARPELENKRFRANADAKCD